MKRHDFSLHLRFQDFVQKLNLQNISNSRLFLYFPLWLLTFYFFFFPANIAREFGGAVFVIHFVMWLILIRALIARLKPPFELIVGLLFLLFSLDSAILRYFYSTSDTQLTAFLAHVHLNTMALSVLGVGTLILMNQADKKRPLVIFTLIAWAAIGIVESGGFIPAYIVQLVLFIFFLRRTKWLEELTQAECWLYLIAGILLFRGVLNWEPFKIEGAQRVIESHLLYGAPWLTVTAFKLYLLAILVKIPIVLVYNFASLSRKLAISTFFQSTFPQLIQATMLVIIFYLFMAGWQAEKVRKAIFGTIDLIASGEVAPPQYWVQLNLDGVAEIKLPGYRPLDFQGDFPREGTLIIEQANGWSDSTAADYFVFKTEENSQDEAGGEQLYLVRLDSSFIAVVAKQTAVLAGSQLVAYPYQPPNWESYLYYFSSHVGISSAWRKFHIFPFALFSRRSENAVTAAIGLHTGERNSIEEAISRELLNNRNLAIGRVIADVLDHRLQPAGFFAFDILMAPGFDMFSKPLLSYMILLALVYSVVNYSVTRRMVKFGAEINKMIVQKFRQLKDGIHEISAGNLDYKLHIEGKDEFVELADRFNQMSSRLSVSIDEAREKERLEHELAIARQVQLDLLPRKLPDIAGFEIAATLQTANEVGGDFYDVVPIGGGKYLFAIGDVSGKGTSAAFYMAQFISLLRYSPEFTDKPDEIACRLNRYFSDHVMDRQVFVTAILGILDTSKAAVRFVRAGHTLPLFVPGSFTEEIQEIRKNGLGIGIERGGVFFEQTLEIAKLKLQDGDAMVFFTDGVEEAARQSQDAGEGTVFYSTERVIETIRSVREKAASEILSSLIDDLQDFYHGFLPVDDYTVLVIKRKSASPKDRKKNSDEPLA